MHLIINGIIIALIVFYAYRVIRKTVKQVKAGKCMSCSSKSGEACHCKRVDTIVGFGDELKNDKEN